jgi:uncharacterized protein HemX
VSSLNPPLLNSSVDPAAVWRRRLLRCYLLWVISLLGLGSFFFMYRQHAPELQTWTVAEYEAQLAQNRTQIEQLSAAVLRNQRELTNAQNELRRVLAAHQELVESLQKK